LIYLTVSLTDRAGGGKSCRERNLKNNVFRKSLKGNPNRLEIIPK